MALQRGQPLPICRGNGNEYCILPLVLTKPWNIFLSAVASCFGAAVPVAFSPTSILSMRSAVGPVLAPPSASAPWFASLDVNALPLECILRHSRFLRQEPLWRKYRGSQAYLGFNNELVQHKMTFSLQSKYETSSSKRMPCNGSMPSANSPVAGSGLDSLLAARKRAVKEGVLCRFGMLDSFPNILDIYII